MNIQQKIQITEDPVKQKIVPPKKYKVLLLNDDFTPMDFVVMLLEDIFFMSEERAMAIMLTVHHSGQGLCGIYVKDIAQMKVNQVVSLARANEYPLQCIMEEEE
ncbi:ATP-dependent Clp protease adapter ClpS [Neisseria sp. Ec49-e6-T10]|uniref:ATP-dependent Clp protease adapter ClpS n=1 Tax=Neisseria sp. Ec49-e6-T10 TaxID=3140744 RepID=UPI003EB910C2